MEKAKEKVLKTHKSGSKESRTEDEAKMDSLRVINHPHGDLWPPMHVSVVVSRVMGETHVHTHPVNVMMVRSTVLCLISTREAAVVREGTGAATP